METNRASLECLVAGSPVLEPLDEGKLQGRTFVVKDLVAIKGHVSSFGNPRWRETHEPASSTAPLVTTLLRDGAKLVGLGKLDQLAYSLVGNVGEGPPPLNPLYPTRFSGGSSSGSASAVAGGLADFGVGTDTAGSVRVPAAACGLYGIRPTHGVIDATGVLPLAESLDVVGFLARSPELLREVFQVATLNSGQGVEPDFLDVLLPEDILETVAEEPRKVLRAAAARIASETGGQVQSVSFGEFVSPEVGGTFARLQGREIWSNHGEWVEQNAEALDTDVRNRLSNCKAWSESPSNEKQGDQAWRDRYRDRLEELVGTRTVVCLPIMTDSTPLRSSSQEEQADFRASTFRLSAPSSLSGLPQLVLPGKLGSSGRVYGVGLLGCRGCDLPLLSLALNVTDGENCLRL